MRLQKIYILFFCFVGGVLSAQSSFTLNPGVYRRICPGTSTLLGGNPTVQGSATSYHYIWRPGKSLSDSTIANPTASPTITTLYVLSVSDGSGAESTKDTVTVFVYPYWATAGPDITVTQGQTISLHGQVATGDSTVWWVYPFGSVYFQNTLNPDVYAGSPGKDTITLVASFPHGCILYAKEHITVLPSTSLVFYNSFTPNGDGSNDAFFIGNLGMYPNNTLDIYNRYGQKVFSKTGYANDWDGKVFGTELPSGTYFYILDTHDDQGGKYHGEVNIIR